MNEFDHPFSLDLNAVVEENLVLYRSHAAHKQIIVQSAIPTQTAVYANSQMLNTILRNLLSNALKFTPSGGLIEVSARPGAEVEIAVSDTRIGICSEDLPKLFRIDTHSTHVGTAGEQSTGLGLSLCKDLVRKNGGSIWVESVPGQGTTFRFTVRQQSE